MKKIKELTTDYHTRDILAGIDMTGSFKELFRQAAITPHSIFLLCVRGSCKISIHLTRYEMSAGSLAIIFPGVYFQILEQTPECRFMYIGIAQRALENSYLFSQTLEYTHRILEQPVLRLPPEISKIFMDGFMAVIRTTRLKQDLLNDMQIGLLYTQFVTTAYNASPLNTPGKSDSHYSRNREIHLKRIDRSPIEIWIAADIILIVIGAVLAAGGLNNLYWQDYWNNGYTIGLDNMMLVSAPLLTGGLLILVLTAAKMINLYGRRIKAGTLGGSMIRALGKRLGIWFGTLYRTRSENGKLILRYVGIALVNLILFLLVFVAFGGYYPGLGLFFLLILVLVNVYLLYRLVQEERGKDAIMAALREISQGNLEYQIDADEMSYQNREMAEEVNRMRDGLKRAVETQLKSERLKTDLIANVSHDIKTPLTSIINYVDILNREHFEDERIAGYVDILVRKSARLKQLTDDLIEASKISSGNITLNMQDMNLKQLIKQTRADGRRMYRVLDNLYNNAAKYAMPYSRVYVDGENRDGKVIFSIKNMSENPLNVSAEELMERFVRGDASRTTEGSGLGLEIARNLTVMQKGTFRLYLDGDLFKVVIVFGEPEEPEHTEREAEQTNDKAQTGRKKQEKKSGKGFRKPHLRIRFRKPVTVERDTDPVSEDDNGELLR